MEVHFGNVIIHNGGAGCGKTSVGVALAEQLRLPFHDADDHHSEENREKMRRGTSLSDEDRCTCPAATCHVSMILHVQAALAGVPVPAAGRAGLRAGLLRPEAQLQVSGAANFVKLQSYLMGVTVNGEVVKVI